MTDPNIPINYLSVPVLGEYYESIGTGFFIGHYFITPAHVVNMGSCHICIGETLYPLTPEGAIVYRSNMAEDEDLAVYDFPEVHSPYELAIEPATEGCKAYVQSHFESEGLMRTAVIEGLITESTRRHIICDIGPFLRPGHSGSPLYVGNCVYGFLVGSPDGHIFAFQSSAHIVKLVNEYLQSRTN